MTKVWNEAELQRHIADGDEESLTLEYKAAGGLARTDQKKLDITKDVSAMGHSAGGTIIYGISEKPAPDDHKPDRIDPIDRTQFSKEWLEQIINLVQPRMDGVIIHPVDLSSAPNHVAYVVEVPQSSGPHQALDKRYYKRYNFVAVPMEHHEILDVMNRSSKPDVEVDFGFRQFGVVSKGRSFILLPKVKNLGKKIVHNFKLTINFPRELSPGGSLAHRLPNIKYSFDATGDYFLDYQSDSVLYPNEERNVGEEMQWQYEVNEDIRLKLLGHKEDGTKWTFPWTLYADDMDFKQGVVDVEDLHNFS